MKALSLPSAQNETVPSEFNIKLYLKEEFILEDGFEEGEVTLKLSEFKTLEAACILVKVRANLKSFPVFYILENGIRTFVRDYSSLMFAVKRRQLLFASTTRFTPSASRTSLSGIEQHTKMVELSTIHPEIQSSIWKSVVRIVIEDFDVTVGTGIVIDKDEDSLYIMTNLHLIVDNMDDYISDNFKMQIAKYLKINPHAKKGAKRKIEELDKDQSIDPPQVYISQLVEGILKNVGQFVLHKDVCWDSDADFDYLIWKIPIFPNCSLENCDYSRVINNSMGVHIFGFPGALENSQFKHQYAIIPAQITGTLNTITITIGLDKVNHVILSTLSAPGLSGSAIVCTQRGTPIGYLGGGFDADGNQQYQSYGYSFAGLPTTLPSILNNKYV